MSVFTLAVHQFICYQQTHGRKQSVGKTLVSNLWIVTKSVDIKYTNGFTDGQSMSKKFTRFILSVIIIYHRQNTICNSIGALTISVAFVVILFQLSRIYRQLVSSVTPSVIVAFAVIPFQLSEI